MWEESIESVKVSIIELYIQLILYNHNNKQLEQNQEVYRVKDYDYHDDDNCDVYSMIQ